MNNDYEIRGNVTAIFLRQKNGTILETTVDTSDLDKLCTFKGRWYAFYSKTSRQYYARCNINLGQGKYTVVFLHRYLLDTPIGLQVDHWDHNGLNNCRSNIRNVTRSINQLNRNGGYGESGFKNVYWHSAAGKWEGRITINQTNYQLGFFNTPEEGNQAVQQFCLERGLDNGHTSKNRNSQG